MEKIQKLFRNNIRWSECSGDRKIGKHNDGFYIIVPNAYNSDSMYITCKLCNEILKSVEDNKSICEYDCCDNCATRWAHARKSEWKNGWRPSSAEIEEELNTRKWLL